ncbi:SGNH hydrolase-type esterase domain containing protein [Trema orientale]|uniref:SGNH hydrolase-type esterase domain containing protein n=1 Tax=Trema orientale TaxID=63057 RepID=A0A2P5EAX4_TREOI|nr:SGNH hydrolase-type esterase domain containing protein [Trema orientale]
MSSFRRNILQGVNFASAGSGILRETGQHRFKEVVSLGKQIQQFAIVEGNLTEVMGPEATAAMLSKCLFLLSVGSNDLLDYSQSKSSKLPNDVYMKTLQATYHDHLKDIKSACCGGGTLNGQVPCAHFLNSTLCLNRDEYLFWDMYHPTEHASKLAALTLYGGGTSLVKPVNLSQLVAASS